MSLLDLKLQKHCIIQDRFDQAAYREVLDQADNLRSLVENGEQQLATFFDLGMDIFAALYKVSPELRDARDVHRSHIYHHGLIERMMGLKEYEELRSYTRMDEVGSALGCCCLGQTILQEIDQETRDAVNQAHNALEQSEKLQEQAASLEELQKLAENQGQNDLAGDLSRQLREAHKDLQKARQRARISLQAIEDKLQSQGNQMRQSIRRGMKKALDEARETAGCLSGWGVEPGQVQKMDFRERLWLAQKIKESPKLKRLAELAGRFKRLAVTRQKTKFRPSRDEIYDVELSSDLNRILPSELALLCRANTRKIFYRNFLEGKLLSYKLRGKEKLGRGPIIVCEDQSGTMKGEREIWAKALSLGLLDIAHLQKRHFAHIAFSSESECITTVCPKGQAHPGTVIALAEHFFSGGTDFETPLAEAMRILQQDEFKNGDVIFVTDGQCSVSEDFLENFLEVKKRKETSIYGILIGSAEDAALREFSDQVTTITDLLQQGYNTAENIFSTV
ncbi:MAG TPA: hypothetical protein ENN18_01520 [Proteobacteria bacterium]|nr:hypothetical protein [Pseudomonadota bacterium]